MQRDKFRNFFKFLGGYLIILMLVLVTAVSCNQRDRFNSQETCVIDSVSQVSAVESMVNPIFTTPEEAIMFQNKLLVETTIDETFMLIPEETLKHVCTVLLKRTSAITKKDIVYEYRANQQIYDGLSNIETSTSKNEQVTDTTATEEQRTLVVTSVQCNCPKDTIPKTDIK